MRTTNRLPARLTGAALLLLLPLALSACSREAPAAAAWEELRAEYEASELGYNELRSTFYPAYVEFAETWWGTKPALEAQLWILQTVRTADLGDGAEVPDVEEIVEAIFDEYADSPHLYLLADTHYLLPADIKQTRFNSLIEQSPHARVRASAMYALADAGARGDATEEQKQRRENLLTGLVDDYSDEPWNETTYGAIASAELNPHDPADLEVGDPAPEIEGFSHDGEPMKLSDYRGKVVVLDFWGDW